MVPGLRFRDQFATILANYGPSQAAIEVLANATIALLDGPSGSGRNTVIQHLIAKGGYQLIISDTTRPPRVNDDVLEQDGVEYWFKSEEEFLDGLRSGDYIEAAIIHEQQISGVSIAEIERAVESQKIAITDIQPDGIEAFIRYKPETICIFMTPPSFEVWFDRLKHRGGMSDEELARRIESARQEFAHALHVDHYQILVNDDIETAVQTTDRICQGDQIDDTHDRAVARQVYEAIVSYQAKLS